jgi:hypothetical protein
MLLLLQIFSTSQLAGVVPCMPQLRIVTQLTLGAAAELSLTAAAAGRRRRRCCRPFAQQRLQV